ncbi:MAG: Gx transporter family protein [Clostridioides difficile]|nr:Gx transporter family protein [Clostridioides sp.]MBS5786737.1 Gx transporter family protein [Clostridioides difficile]
MRTNKTSKMIYMSLLVSMALILSLIERTIPVPFITPGAKLGLANLIIVISVYTLDNYREAFAVLILRLLLSTLLGSTVSALLYSATGGVLSFIVTILVKKLGGKYVSVIGVSTSAAVFHNIGQLFAASLILNNFGVFIYLPILSIAGIGTGFFIGLSANYILNHLKKLPQFRGKLMLEESL